MKAVGLPVTRDLENPLLLSSLPRNLMNSWVLGVMSGVVLIRSLRCATAGGIQLYHDVHQLLREFYLSLGDGGMSHCVGTVSELPGNSP